MCLSLKRNWEIQEVIWRSCSLPEFRSKKIGLGMEYTVPLELMVLESHTYGRQIICVYIFVIVQQWTFLICAALILGAATDIAAHTGSLPHEHQISQMCSLYDVCSLDGRIRAIGVVV